MRDLETIKNEIIQDVYTNQSNVDVTDGSVIRDVMIDPQSIQIYFLEQQIEYLKQLSAFVLNAENLDNEDLDNIGKNFNVERGAATQSEGTITFRATSLPTTSIRIGNIDGTGGISVKTQNLEDNTSINFTTTETVYLTPQTEFNTESGYYEVNAHIKSSITGSISNVSIGSINTLGTIITGIVGCYNYIATTGGNDTESNIDYADDISVAIQGTNNNTYDGILKLINTYNVTDFKVYHPNSTYNPTKLGFVDILIRGSENLSTTDTITYNSSILYYSLIKKPINEIVNVTAKVNGVTKTLTQNVDYYLYTDSDSVYAYSNKSGDGIKFIQGSENLPDTNTTFTVTYTYNNLIDTIQAGIENKLSNIIILGNIIIKQALPIIIYVTTNIKLKDQYNTTQIQNEIKSGLEIYIQSLPINTIITQTNIYNYILNTYKDYIEYINYPFEIFKSENDLTTNNANIIQLNYNEYSVIDSTSIIINWE